MTASHEVVEGFRLSSQQATLWLSGGQDSVLGCRLALSGPIDVRALRRAIEHVTRRHEILRTCFRRLPAMALPLQVVQADMPARWHEEGLGTTTPDLAEGPVLTAGITVDSPSSARLDLRLPAMNTDAGGMVNLVEAICRTYRELRSGDRLSPSEAVQYVQYSEWQHGHARETEDGERYWKGLEERDTDAAWPLPTTPESVADRLRGAVTWSLPADVVRELDGRARDAGAEPSDVLFAAWTALLSRMAGRDVVVHGVVDARTFDELRDAIGPFSLRLPVRVGAAADLSFEHLLGEIAATLDEHRAWLEHAPATAASRPIVFEHLRHPAMFDLGDARAAIVGLDAHLPGESLRLTCRRAGDAVTLDFGYDLAVMGHRDAARVAEMYVTLLRSALDTPASPVGALRWLGDHQRREVLDAFNPPIAPVTGQSFKDLFEAQVRRSPEAVAVRCAGETLTYAELNRRANALAARLREAGVEGGAPVAMCLESSVPALVGIVGILKAGGAYMPVDPADPVDRQLSVLRHADAAAVVGGAHLAGRLPDGMAHLPEVAADDAEHSDPLIEVRDCEAAYIIHTSGSTGRPKGVVVAHSSLANYLTWVNDTLVGDVAVPAVSRLTFDASLKQVLAPLVRGGDVWLLPHGVTADPDHLYRVLRDHEGPVGFNGVPSLWQALIDVASTDPGVPFGGRLTRVMLGGDTLPPRLVERTRAVLPGVEVWNLYGPTEATANAGAGPVEPGETVTIGRPIANTQIYLLDRDLEPVPVGLAGRLHVGGAGVARGYVGLPAETAERFVPHPFSDLPGARLYDTGDLARFTTDGRLEFLGRDDLQIKLYGFRIELEGVEASLRLLPGVRDAAVALKESPDGGRRLLGYLVPESGARLAVPSLRERILDLLPGYMVPAELTVVEALPLTPTGKLDRRALTELVSGTTAADGAAAPRTFVEDQLIGIWSMLLGHDRIGLDDGFFAMGGHSLLVIRLMSRVHEVFGVELPPRALFRAPTLRALAALVEAAMAERREPRTPALAPAPADREPALSFGQERLWILEQMEPGSPRHNVLATRRIVGTVAPEAVREALDEIVRRHEVLRTGFLSVDGMPRLVVHDRVHVALDVVDDHDDLARLASVPFDLARPPLLRAVLLREGPQEAVLVLIVHHIACDGWAKTVLLSEFAELYGGMLTGVPADLPALPVQYSDFAAWQRDRLTDEVLVEQLAYWRERLDGAPTLRLATDRHRPARRLYKGGAVRRALPDETTRALRRLSVEHGATLVMTTLTAFAILLARYSGQRDIVVGTPAANRNRVELENLIGFFVNTIALRMDLSGDPSFAELLDRGREVALAAYANQDLPFEKLVEELQPERDLSRSPIFQVMYVHVPPGAPEVALGEGTRLEPADVEPGTALFDLNLSVLENPGGLELNLNFDAELFDAATAERMLAHLEEILRAVAEDPARRLSALPSVPEADRSRIAEWSGTAEPAAADECLHQLIEAQAERTPDAVAVEFDGGSLTYREVNERANRLAHRLSALGVGPETLVAVCAERSSELVVGLLAVLKAGGAYVPVDPGDPADRVAALLTDVSPALALTDRAGREKAAGWPGMTVPLDDAGSGAGPAMNPDVTVDPDNAVYVIFTSGSTGKPKGAVNTHRAVCNELRRMQDVHRLDGSDAVLLKTRLTFDVSVWEYFWPLTAGARIVVTTPQGHLDPHHLARVIETRGVTTAQFVPTMLRAYLDSGAPSLDRLRRVLCIGEALPYDLRDRFLTAYPGVRLFNLYGPAEAAIHVTDHECEIESGQRPVPIGRFIPNTAVHLLDLDLSPVPVGVPGELYIGGACLARGYLNAPRLTAERFVPDPFGETPGARLYATGDLARYRPDGELEFLGRIDHQLKIRGHRVEPGEVEAALMRLPGVAEALVAPFSDASGTALAAYVTPAGGAELSAARVREELGRDLPAHMIPRHVTVLPELPRSANGKLDRKALPEPGPRPDGDARLEPAPRDGLETRLAKIWEELLDISPIGVDDDFVRLGGHSLLMIRLASRVRDAFGVELSPLAVIETPRLADYAERLRRETGAPVGPPARRLLTDLSHAQERLWFASQVQPGNAVFNIAAAWKVDGDIDAAVAERAIAAVAARHQTLRSAFVMVGGEPKARVEDAVTVPVQVADLRGRADRADEWLREFGRAAFDLGTPPLLRTALVRTAEHEWVLAVVMHHIVGDAWSIDVFIRDFAESYRRITAGDAPDLAPLPAQYADFAAWQRRLLRGADFDRQLAFWRSRLDGAPALELVTDRPRPEAPSRRSGRARLTLPQPVLEAVRETSARLGVTSHMSLMAALSALLGRYSGQTDFTIGVPVTNRTRTEFEGLVGCFVNTLAIRADLSGDPSFAELVGRTRDMAMSAYEHQDIPLERVIEELRPAREGARSPLFQVLFQFMPRQEAALELPGATLRQVAADTGTTFYDLRLLALEELDGLHLILTYDRDLFEPATAERMVADLGAFVTAATSRPDTPMSRLSWSAGNQPDRRDDARATASVALVHRRFDDQVRKTPDAAAVTHNGRTVSYRELDELATRMAARLRAYGAGPGALVGVMLERSVELIAGVLAVLRTGAAYLPLDPGYPAERTRLVLSDAEPAMLLTTRSLAEQVGGSPPVIVDVEAEDVEAQSGGISAVSPQDAAYVIYTSGSTGRPKGVVVTHHNLAQSTAARVDHYGSPVDTFLLLSSIAFDSSVAGLFWTLCTGGRLVLPGEGGLGDAGGIASLIERERVTHVLSVPSLYAALHDVTAPPRLRSLRVVIVAGETVPPRLPKTHHDRLPDAALWNEYGVTEAGVWSSVGECPPGVHLDPIPAGRPIAGTTLHILDDRLTPVPVGAVGELHIGGAGIGRGYLRRPALTAERFVPDPFSTTPGARLYRTGDMARLRPDGSLVLCGRADNQVKVRGHRIEPEEVEAVLRACPGVRDAVVALTGDTLGAHVVAEPGAVIAVDELRARLRARLPEPLVPGVFAVVDELPRTPNGKVDRTALAALHPGRDGVRDRFQAPRSELEDQLAGLWAELFDVPSIGVNDDFFELGGHSLLALHLFARIEDSFQVKLPMHILFDAPTVAELADRVAHALAGHAVEGGS
ncbi:amino acid adenylation domain-containing protein [Nonomuraea sp. NPDC049400]|uniref:amino acid adenylation domain-containing protein n=1 Tax=Nonomuraea sp. NPDC049400 TaxID=3364352 RepID=UPI0037B8D2ED